jgi:hypothetical protein
MISFHKRNGRFKGSALEDFPSGLPEFSWHDKPKLEKYTKMATKIPKCHKIYQNGTKKNKWT